MPFLSPFESAGNHRQTRTCEHRGVRTAADFGDVAGEFDAARTGPALVDRSDRVLLRIGGRDRKTWLHNLITCDVKNLDVGQGSMAFACDVQGRIQFEMVLLAQPDELWLDLDRLAAPAARAHLDRYLITEDVQLFPIDDRTARLALIGPGCEHMAGELGVGNFAALPDCAHGTTAESLSYFKHGPAGGGGLELILPIDAAVSLWRKLSQRGARPIGMDALQALRIEAGVPWPGLDLDNTVLPAETGLLEQAVSFHKGCYLGQEVIERMRSRGALARKLARFELDDGVDLSLPAAIGAGDRSAGRLTSLVRHPHGRPWIGLGYLRTSVADVAELVAGDPPRPVRRRS